ncbi:MAG: hypothetical protein ACI9LE_002170 [Paraglaciecola sp.]|jgi:hypothetical protein
MKSKISSVKATKKYKEWQKKNEKSGQYQPFLTVQKVRKISRRHMLFCNKQKHIIHLLSDGETRTYIGLIRERNVVEIHEQCPLDIQQTLNLSIEKNILHPRCYITNQAYVMSTDFVVRYIDFDSGKTWRVAYTFKYRNDLYDSNGYVNKSSRTWQKLSLEAAYWAKEGIKYKILDETIFNKEMIFNINWFATESQLEVEKEELILFTGAFKSLWELDPRQTIENIIIKVADQLSLTFQKSQSLFKYSAYHQLLSISIEQPLGLSSKVDLL